MTSSPASGRPAASPSLLQAITSWRTLSVALLSFSSGLPLGLLWIAIPDWMRNGGIDIRLVGLTTLAQAPYTFKMVWSPLMDRYTPPWMGRRRGWIAVAQIALFVLVVSLAGVGDRPETVWVVLALAMAIAFASASQDIVIDAYAVDVLRRDEQGIAVGLRIALYRAAMFVAGGMAIWWASLWSWPLVNVMLGCLFLPMLIVTRKAPEPEEHIARPASLRQSVWLPFLGFLSRHRAVEILAFVFFYKFADQLAQSLQRPFLIDMGYSDFDRGVSLSTIGLVATLVGTFLGGALTTSMGLGHSLWVFGLIQIVSNAGFILVSQSEINRPLMYGAMGFEALATGLGMGAYGVLLLRMTQKRFSATQYALFSSLFGLPRLIAGPITGLTVHAVGWTTFFWCTMVAGLPGLVLLWRFVPPGTREPTFTVEPPRSRRPLASAALAGRGVVSAVVAGAGGLAVVGLLDALETWRRAAPVGEFALGPAFAGLFAPSGLPDWLRLFGVVVFAVVCGLFVAAVAAARHGAGMRVGDEDGLD